MPLANDGPDVTGDDVTISTSATLLYTASHRASSNEPEVVIVQNNDASIQVTVGGPDVSDASNGIVLPANNANSISVPLRTPGAQVYAAAASGTPTVQVLRA